MREGPEARAMTVRDVANYLNVNEKTVYRLAQQRALPGFKVAGAWRFQPADIDDWIEAQKKAEIPTPAPQPRGTRRRIRGSG